MITLTLCKYHRSIGNSVVLRKNVSAKLVCHKAKIQKQNKINIYLWNLGLTWCDQSWRRATTNDLWTQVGLSQKQSPNRSFPSELVISHQYCKLNIFCKNRFFFLIPIAMFFHYPCTCIHSGFYLSFGKVMLWKFILSQPYFEWKHTAQRMFPAHRTIYLSQYWKLIYCLKLLFLRSSWHLFIQIQQY